MPHLILVNEALKEYLVTAAPAEKQRLREKLYFLANGYWEGGVRVKKLRAPARQVVFEARLDRGRRLLFTLGRDRGESAVHVWGVVAHDDVGAAARRIAAAASAGRAAPAEALREETHKARPAGEVAAEAQSPELEVLPANAPFLRADPEETEERSELSLDGISEDWYTQEALAEKARADYGPQKWMVVGDDEWERLLRTSKPDDIELHLRLTSAQESILAREPPLLLSGTAGSGKTTISVYYLLRSGASRRRLFVTYSPWLKRYSRRIYDGLRSGNALGQAKAADRAAPPPGPDGAAGCAADHGAADFLTLRELLDAILEAAGSPVDPAREVRLPEFDRIFRSHASYGRYDTQLVWEEIRSLIKGAEANLSPRRLRELADLWSSRSLLPRDLRELAELLYGLKALALGGKAEELVTRRSRFRAYDDFVLALGSQEGGERADAASALDLVAALVEKRGRAFERPLLALADYEALGRRRAPNFAFDRREIYAVAEYYQGRLDAEGLWDEIDLTRRAMAALARAGDRFEYDLVVCDELQDFAEAQISLLFRLARDPRGLVLTGDPRQIINPTGFRWEETRRRFYERRAAVPDVIHLDLNFRCVGSIVALGNALLELKRRLVGLEGSEFREEWKFEGRPPLLISGVAEEAVLARVDLSAPGRMIIARTPAEQRRLKERLGTELVFTVTEAKGLEFDTVLLWKPSAGAADLWRRLARGQGRERDHAAMIRHEINVLYVGVTRARNSLLVYDGNDADDTGDACGVWQMPELQGRLFVSREPDALEQAWQVVSTPQDWARQGDYLFDHEQFAAAAECYRHAGSREREQLATAERLRRAGQPDEAAPLFAALGRDRDAAECWQAARAWGEALALWRRLGDDARALPCEAELAEARRDWRRAAELWRRSGDGDRALKAARQGGDHAALATFYFDQGKLEEAAAEWDKAGDAVRAADTLIQLGRLDEAAGRLFDAGRVARAAAIYSRLRDHRRLLACYQRLGDHQGAAALAEKLRDWPAAEQALRGLIAAVPRAAERIAEDAAGIRGANKLARAAIRYAALGREQEAAPLFARAGLLDRAVAAYSTAGLAAEAADCLARARRFKDAAEAVEGSQVPDRHVRAAQYLSRHVMEARRGQERNARAREVADEGERLMRSGDCLRALARFRSLTLAERALEAYVCLRYDEEALLWLVEMERFDLAERYLGLREGYAPSLQFAPRFTAALEARKYALTARRRGTVESLGAAFFKRVIGVHGVQASRDSIDSWLGGLTSIVYGHTDVEPAVLDLVFEVRHYNSLARLLQSWTLVRSAMQSPEAMEVLRRIDQAGAGDPALAACALLVRDRRSFDAALAGVELSLRTWQLFALSRLRYAEAVQLLHSSGRTGDAVSVCLRNDDFARAARLAEAAQDLPGAARHYLQANEPERALSCYERLGSDPGRARALERMGRFEEALAIHEARHNRRDSERVRRKIRDRPVLEPPDNGSAPQSPPAQRELF